MKEKFPKEKQKGLISFKNMEYRIEDEDRRVVSLFTVSIIKLF